MRRQGAEYAVGPRQNGMLAEPALVSAVRKDFLGEPLGFGFALGRNAVRDLAAVLAAVRCQLVLGRKGGGRQVWRRPRRYPRRTWLDSRSS